jgi:hypothetical protein
MENNIIAKTTIDKVSKLLNNRLNIMDKINKNEEKINLFLGWQDRSDKNENFLAVLRRWNSYTPSIVAHDSCSKGGGYFLFWNGKGVIIDPGFNYIENFYRQGLRISDIDCIIITHAHIDHCADLEPIMTLIFEYNENRKKQIEKENKEIQDEKLKIDFKAKKVELFLNLGTFKKLGGWITSCYKDIIKNITILQARLEKNIADDKLIRLEVTRADHKEIWSDEYSIGLIFKLFTEDTDIPALSLGFTSDTGWSGDIQKQYNDCDILVLHFGGIKKEELDCSKSYDDKKRLYKNHLGIIGITAMLLGLFKRPSVLKLALISEFGEELKGLRKNIMDTIIEEVSQSLNNENPNIGNVLMADIGTKLTFTSSSGGHQIKLCCEYGDCNVEAEPKDVILRGGLVGHFCTEHTPYIADSELLGLL